MKGPSKGLFWERFFFGFAASPTKCSSFGCLFVCCVEVLKKELGHKFLKINTVACVCAAVPRVQA